MRARAGTVLPPQAWAGLALCLAAFAATAGAQQAQAASGEQPARAARVIPRGTVLSADDIMFLGDSIPAVLPIGWVTRRVVQVGEALRPPAIGQAPVVHNGSNVQVRAGNARLSVQRFGTALEAGAVGDTIRVRLDRAASIHAIVRDSITVVPVTSSRP